MRNEPLMEQEIQEKIIEVLSARHKNGSLVSEADFLVGAMQMYLLLKPESEENGSWCPPKWVFGIMGGDSFVRSE